MKTKLTIALIAAAVLWCYMFSPWTAGMTGFWPTMACAACLLTALAVCFTRGEALAGLKCRRPLIQVAAGVGIALVLWGVFWVGDRLSALLFGFARPQVDAVYAMKDGFPAWVIALLLLLLIGPAEEFFWRGFVQKQLTGLMASRRHPAFTAMLLTLAVYGFIHIWSMNFMLVMAALVAGTVWGLLYMLKPSLLPALIISHAVWDALVFVIMPI